MSTLQAVWQQVKYYLENGVSVIPVRDKPDEKREAKTPYGTGWKKYQREHITEQQLWFEMEENNTNAVGLIGGKVSGNLEIIDIDVKYLPGVDADLFTAISELYPELWAILRIHKTPSGGYHILYRCAEGVEGNNKLAGRPADDAELALRPKNKTYNFIETRGEGGYVVAPPAMGYSVHFDRPIPTISQADRASLISLCKSFSRIVTIKKEYKPTQHDNQYYDENPFEHFNATCNPDTLASELGWELCKERGRFRWYTRPGKTTGISMSFNTEKRFFYCFTSSTELEESHGYTPAILLSTLAHGGDRKKTYAYLVQRGYGRIKQQVEERIAKKTAAAGRNLPPNASPHAAALHVAISQKMATDHPHGIFWFEDPEKGTIQIDRERLYTVADGLGYKVHNDEPVQILANLIYNRTPRDFFDAMKDYIREEDGDEYIRICNSYEAFIERHGKFTISRLQLLQTGNIIEDTRTECYKFYNNGMLLTTATGYELQEYPPNRLVWSSAIHSRDYIQCDAGKFVDFIEKAIGLSEYLLQTVGYLVHEFKDETAGYIVVLSEQCPNPKDGGGSGKNIFSSLLSRITSILNKPGSQVKYDERFMQSWNFQKIFCVSDVPKSFDFSFLKELSTGSSVMKKLFINEYIITPDQMCKFLISTNFSYEIKDGGLKRRIKPIEFTDFFTRSGGVDAYYKGCHFPNDWTAEDWGGYDTFMALAAQAWLKAERKLSSPILTSGGWQKQFEQTYGSNITEFITENYSDWMESGWVSNEDFKKQLFTYYDENNVPKSYQPGAKKIYDAIAAYCDHHGAKFENNYQKKTPVNTKGKLFTATR